MANGWCCLRRCIFQIFVIMTVPTAHFVFAISSSSGGRLRQDEIVREVEVLVDEGHKRVLLVAGESYPQEGLEYVFKAIDSVYSVHRGKSGSIRRVNVNLAPLSVADFKALKSHDIGTYQIFQETYHLPTYHKMHLAGPKKDYVWRVEAPGRAMEAGIDDVGVGILFGLYDYRFEILATDGTHRVS